MAKMHLQVGMDDIATGTGKAKGWSFLIFPEFYRSKFDASVEALRRRLGKAAFHGKDYTRGKGEQFEGFLQIVHERILSTPQARFVMWLCSESVFRRISEAAHAALNAIAKPAGLTAEEDGHCVLNGAGRLAVPLFVL